MKIHLLITVFATLLFACGEKPAVISKPHEEGYSGKEGDRLKNGQLVFHIFESVKDDPPFKTAVFVAEDYGMIIFNTGSYEAPVVTVKFCSADEGWIKSVDGIENVLSFIKTLSKKTTIGVYDTCSVPRGAGIPHAEIERIYQSLASRQITVQTQKDHQITCICPTQE